MDKEFYKYKEFCRKNGLKECKFESLLKYFDRFNKKDVPVQVVLPMSKYDRLHAVEDYILWAEKKDLSMDFSATFVRYKDFVMKGRENEK